MGDLRSELESQRQALEEAENKLLQSDTEKNTMTTELRHCQEEVHQARVDVCFSFEPSSSHNIVGEHDGCLHNHTEESCHHSGLFEGYVRPAGWDCGGTQARKQ